MRRWDVWVADEANSIRESGRWRTLRPVDGCGPQIEVDGRNVVSFASNDYLGLSADPRVRNAAADAALRWGSGTGSSRLIVGDRPLHAELEAALARWRGTEAALVFPTGYQTNVGVLTTFGAGARIVSDELNHASIIDGARLARAEVSVYRHGDLEQAAALTSGTDRPVILVSDTVFSMDGDLADLPGLSQLAADSGALLVLDDAHAVMGSHPVHPDANCLRVGTLSKALGSQGGFVAGPRSFIDLLVNRARSFIFTTGLNPPAVAAGLAAVTICASSEGDALVDRLRHRIDLVRPGHPSPVIPIIVGDEEPALNASDKLLGQGLLVPAIRPPTVAPGTCRLRLSLSSAHRIGDVEQLAKAIADL